MSIQYSRPQAVDGLGNTVVNSPAPYKALASYGASPNASSVITLTDNTTAIEVGAVGGNGIAIKWIATTDTTASVIGTGATANFDHFVPANTVRRFVVPIERIGVSSIVGANKANGLYQRVAWIGAVAPSSSVLGTEY